MKRGLFSVAKATVVAFIAITVSMALTPGDLFAMEMDKEIKVLTDRIEDLETKQAEIYHTKEEKRAAGLKSKIAENISLGGVIEIEAAADNDELHGNGSDLTLATVELALEVETHEYVDGHIILLFEEGEESDHLIVDEGVINLKSPYGLNLALGKLYVPFGNFHTHFISDPQTLELAETNDTAAVASWGNDLIGLQFGIFNGDVDTNGSNDIEDYVAAATITPVEGVEAGLSYISDISETDADITGLNGTGVFISDEIPGFSAYITAEFGQFSFSGELVGATRGFKAADLDADGDGNGDKPEAYNIEAAYGVNDDLELAVRFEGNNDFSDLPEDQYGVAASYGLFTNTTVGIEYLHGEYHTGEERDLLTAQLALEF